MLAHFSGFRVGEVKSLNWDIVLMLTPLGLVEHWFLGLTNYLHQAYFQSPPPYAWSFTQEKWNWEYLYVFMQSNLLEVLFLVWLWPRWKPARVWLVRTTLVNSLTHPVVFFLLMKLPLGGYLGNILAAETFAVCAEAYLYRRIWRMERAFLASLLANLWSWQLAPVLTALIFFRDKL
jgi:hypothetical protein